MTEQMAKHYHDQIIRGVYRMEPWPNRKNWWVIIRRENDKDIPVRYVGPKNALQIEQA